MNYSHQLPQINQMQQPLPPQQIPNYNQTSYNIEGLSKTNNRKFNLKKLFNMSILRKIFVITLLYVIISHSRTTLLMCNNIPYICVSNALSYNIAKGLLMSLVIVIFYNIM